MTDKTYMCIKVEKRDGLAWVTMSLGERHCRRPPERWI